MVYLTTIFLFYNAMLSPRTDSTQMQEEISALSKYQKEEVKEVRQHADFTEFTC